MESMSWSFWSPAKGSSPSEQGEKNRQEKSEYWRTVLKHLKDATQQEKKICVNPTYSSCTARVRQRDPRVGSSARKSQETWDSSCQPNVTLTPELRVWWCPWSRNTPGILGRCDHHSSTTQQEPLGRVTTAAQGMQGTPREPLNITALAQVMQGTPREPLSITALAQQGADTRNGVGEAFLGQFVVADSPQFVCIAKGKDAHLRSCSLGKTPYQT